MYLPFHRPPPIMAAASPLPSLASLSVALPDAEGWSAEEVAAIKETKRLLLEGGTEASKISPMELSLCVMNCKLRPAKAVQKCAPPASRSDFL